LAVIQKTINGFRKCAQIAAHYSMSDVFDNIVIALCKFTALTSSSSASATSPSASSSSSQLDSNADSQLAVSFGMNNKAHIACKTVFQLTHSHGDILRDGWGNILDCIVQLYKARLLPKVLVECEDYLSPKGRIVLLKEEPIGGTSKTEASSGGLFSSFFPFMSSDLAVSRGPTPEEQEATRNAQACIDECHIEQLIHDTKFLRVDSLLELVKALIAASTMADADLSGTSGVSSVSGSVSTNSNNGGNGGSGEAARVDSDAAVFSLEVLIKVVLQNRDRISCVWPTVRGHFYNIVVNANEYSFFLERTVVGLLRITARLLRREELAAEVLASLRMLLLFKKRSIVRRLSRQVTFGLHDLLRTNAANIHANDDWSSVFTLLQVYGAGATAPLLAAAAVAASQQYGSQNFDDASLVRSYSVVSSASKVMSLMSNDSSKLPFSFEFFNSKTRF
jgi:brefeldin A-resistance guanine nucleotide exchange factor 1